MIEHVYEWGDFSEWLERINACVENEHQAPVGVGSVADPSTEPTMKGLLDSLNRWVETIEDAPVTTWKEELSVRGFDYLYEGSENELLIHEKLWSLLEGLAGMGVYLINTDHLSERALYQFLVEEVIVKTIAQIPSSSDFGCIIDIVGLEVPEEPTNWLMYYANSRERMEWAKQNCGKPLPAQQNAPFPREELLPKSTK